MNDVRASDFDQLPDQLDRRVRSLERQMAEHREETRPLCLRQSTIETGQRFHHAWFVMLYVAFLLAIVTLAIASGH